MKPYYQDDWATIYHGDCREVLPLVEFDAVVTDPPYSSGARRDAEKSMRHGSGSMLREFDDAEWFNSDAMTAWGFSWFVRGVFSGVFRSLPQGGHLYLFCDWRQTPNLYGMLESVGLRVNHCLVWDKMHFGMGNCWRNQHENIIFASKGTPADGLHKGAGTVLRHKNTRSTSRVHPTEKPEGLIASILSVCPGERVIDPFMGSGTTPVAAKNLGRKSIGIEIEERYCEIAAKRLAQGVLWEASA